MGKVDDRKEWRMPSSRGHRWFAIQIRDGSSDADTSIFQVEMGEEPAEATGALQGPERVPELRLNLSRVVLSHAALMEMRGKMERWFDTLCPFQCTLTPENAEGQALSVKIGRDERFICSDQKPVFTVEYEGGLAFKVAWSYVVDQSCIREFISGRG